MDLVRARADKMRGFINVEGNCAPVTTEEVTKVFAKVPLLSLWGDNSHGAILIAFLAFMAVHSILRVRQ